MHHFAYKDGVLHAEDIALPALAEKVETPFYCYSAATIRRHFTVFAKAFDGLDALVCYAMKANSNQAVLTLLASLGAGMDVVSGGELARALKAGVRRERSPSPASARRRERSRRRWTPGFFASTSSPSPNSRPSPPSPPRVDGARKYRCV